MTVAAAVPVFVPDVPAAVLTAMALASAVQAVSTAPEFPVEPAAAVPVVSVLSALPVLYAAELLHAAAVSAAEASLLHVTLAAAQLSERQPESLHDPERQPEALQIELPASVPDIPAEAVRRFATLPAASASAVPSSPASEPALLPGISFLPGSLPSVPSCICGTV